MGTFESFRKAYGALKDSTTVGLAKVNSDFKDLDIAVVKATNHVEAPPKERHIRKIFAATSVVRPRADVAYCIHALSRRLSKTRNWIVAIKVLTVIHRTLREGDPTFREELLNYSHRGHIFQISNFKDDSTPLAWDCSAWIRAYALFLEERLECFRVLKYDIEAERLTRSIPGTTKVHSKTRLLTCEELLEQLPALQQLLYRLMGCQPEGLACTSYLIQYALALILKESFKIYCAINDGIINLVDMYFNMPKHVAVKALTIYKRAGQQAEYLSDFYEFSKRLDLARNFQFPTLRQPPPTFLVTMEEYVKEASPNGAPTKPESQEKDESRKKPEESEEKQEVENEPNEEPKEEPQQPQPQPRPESPPLISTDDNDLLGLHEIDPRAAELEESNALALAIIAPGGENQPSSNRALMEPGTSGWELALVTTPSNTNTATTESQPKLGGGFDNLLLDSLYEDENARRELQMRHAGYNPHGMGVGFMQPPNPFEQQQPNPFYNMMQPNNMQVTTMYGQQQQQQQYYHQMAMQQQSQPIMMPYQNEFLNQYHPYGYHRHQPTGTGMDSGNPFGDPFCGPTPQIGPHALL